MTQEIPSILVVDDTPGNLQVLGEILEREGFEVRVTTTGEEALDMCQRNPPDLVLLDVVMPGMDGFTVCKSLQNASSTRGIPIIFISALESQGDKIRGFREGAVDYVTKPFQAEEVLARVRTHLRLVKVEALTREVEERKIAQTELEKVLADKDLLIRELYHRTRNTLQLVRGLLILKAGEMSGESKVQVLVQAMEQRIDAISLVHQMLYEGQDLSNIPMSEYADRLSRALMKAHPGMEGKVELKISAGEGSLLLDTAVPLGLIITELMVNSLIWAFPQDRNGTIALDLKIDGDGGIMNYQDNGIGLADDFLLASQKTLGLTLVRKLAESQMKGKITVDGSQGVKVVFTFPLNLYQKRVDL